MDFDFDIGPQLPVPHKDDVLFWADYDDVCANACLHFAESPEVLYSFGYLNAARKLRDHVLECRVDLDTFIFPIVYLYRHHIELLLKSLVVNGVEIVERELSPTEQNHLGDHNLKCLWEDIRPILEDVCKKAGWKPPSQEEIEGINAYVLQLTKHKPDAFRFPASKKGEAYLVELTHINVRVFSDAMERLSDFLDNLDEGFRGFLGLRDQALAEARERVTA